MEYKSKYNDEPVNEAHHLVEIFCERMAAKDKIALSPAFWKDPQWKKTYALQMIHVRALLKIYQYRDIIDALNSPAGKRIYSAGYKKGIKELIDKIIYNRELQEKKQSLQPKFDSNVVDNPTFQTKKSKNRLDKLDG